ncbi:MAG: DUF2569 domain-containing protein [Bacteroides sp.]|nr:DUF2569 domain-containing protein [Bacteroides sp.]
MENSPYVYKSPNNQRIHGWLLFFLITVGIGILVNIALSITSFNIEDYNWTESHLFTFILASLDILFTIGIVGFGIFMIYSFVKRNSNAPIYGIIYCCLLLYSTCIQLFVALIDDETDIIAGNEVKIARNFIWSIIWILYFIMSDQVQMLFPKENRKLPNSVLLITAAIVLCPFSVFFASIYIAAGM